MPVSPASIGAPAVVLDTNAVLDAFVFEDPRIAPLSAAIYDGRVRWIAEPRLRMEFADVVQRSKFIGHHRSGQALTSFDRWACLLAPAARHPVLVCRDPDDQPFLDLAIEAGARWLLTRDKALLALRRRALAHGLTIVVPEAWSG